jgi:AbrB family looped-hinge helix DNA binding protein
MAEIVHIDDAGRLVIPKAIRKSIGISGGEKFVIAEVDEGRIFLQKIDVQEIADNLKRELKGKNIDAVVKKVRKEMNEKVKKKYPKMFS